MDPIRIVEFDVHANNPANKIPRERIKLRDKTLPWIIPNGSPFYAIPREVTVYAQNGGILSLGRDYFFEGDFIPFCYATNKKVSSFIRLSDEVLQTNAYVEIDYRSMGAYFVPRNELEDWLYLMHHGKIPVPWSKVFGVPPTLPPAWHKHNIKTEIGDWFELTYFYAYLANVYTTVDTGGNVEITEAVDAAFARLNETKTTYMERMRLHDGNYHNPHEADAFDVNMGNHDNFRTATLEEDKAGVLSNVLSTSLGIQELAKSYIPDTDDAMRSGIMPISYFGGESFIPPSISGSFEGLGSKSEITGACLETNGQVMILANHFDGRVDGLYFTTVDDHRGPAPKITYTGYRYAPPDLEAIGFVPNAIVGGSGSKVIMVGKEATNDWYIALTNGTFNPATHQFVKCDMTAVNLLQDTQVYDNHFHSTLVETEDYLLLVHAIGTYLTGEQFAFFRISKAAIRSGANVAWELLKVTYMDHDGVTHAAADFVQPFKHIKDGNDHITRSGPWTFRQPASSWYRTGKPQAWACAYPGVGGLSMLHLMFEYVFVRDGSPIALIADTAYLINAATGVLTLASTTAPLSVGFTDTTATERYAYLTNTYGPFRYIGGLGWVSCTILDDGTTIMPYPSEGSLFPLFIQRTVFPGYTQRDPLLLRPLSVASIGGLDGMGDFANVVKSPIPSGAYPVSLSYEPDGEMYTAADPVDNLRKTFFRKITGAYQARATINNLVVNDVKSRPLTNDIYRTNLLPVDGVVSLTGSAPHLGAVGLESGSNALSMCGWTSTPDYPYTPLTEALRAPVADNMVVSFPRTHMRTLNVAEKTATYQGATFYGLRQAAMDQIKEFIPPAYRNNTPSWCFTLQMLEAINGGLFYDLGVGVLTVNYYDMVNLTARTQLVLVTLVTEPPGGNHLSTYLITGFTVLDKPDDVLGFNGATPANPDLTYNARSRAKPSLSCYRHANRLTCYNSGAFGGAAASTNRLRMWVFFDINLITMKLENIAQATFGQHIEDQVTMIPQQGMTDLSLHYNDRETVQYLLANPSPFNLTGGAAAIYKQGADYYLTSSAYPETGWVVYFQEDIPLMINGTAYTMPGGTIDLRDVDFDPRNKTFYVYATVVDSDPKYILSLNKLRKGNSMLLVCVVTTNNQQILTIDRRQPCAVGDHQLSYFREGGTIPVSTGLPQEEGTFIFLRQSELLP